MSTEISRLDSVQASAYQNFPQGHYLSTQQHFARAINWITYYRRNIGRFVTHYLGLNLHLYQHILLWLMNARLTVGVVASRATAKSWLIAVLACSRAILYPGSLIVLASATRKQSKLLVTEKIETELIPRSQALASAISRIVNNTSDTEVNFNNGSKITVVTANDNARGYRSHLIVYEEFRQIKKSVIDSVFAPFQVSRTPAYMSLPQYDMLQPEEPMDFYISSAWYRSHWMWKSMQTWMQSFLNNGSCALIALDYAVSLMHKIKTRRVIMKDKRDFDDITFRIEYENEMVAENTAAYFPYLSLNKNQRITQAFYPRLLDDFVSHKKNPFDIPKQTGEIRLISCDMAFVNREGNDNSAFSCIRLLPESRSVEGYDGRSSVQKVYRNAIPYMEAFPGGDTTAQARRIKQLDADFGADYVVLDTRNGGIAVYDMLAKVLYDEERGVEYAPWRCMNDDNIASRIRIEGATSKLFAVTASTKLNSDIAINMRQALDNGMVDLLISPVDAIDDVLVRIPQYVASMDAETLLWYERPYRETQALINEMIELQYERMQQTGAIRIFEQSGRNKDRYTSVSYGVYFSKQLELDIFNNEDDGDYGSYAGSCVSSVTL